MQGSPAGACIRHLPWKRRRRQFRTTGMPSPVSPSHKWVPTRIPYTSEFTEDPRDEECYTKPSAPTLQRRKYGKSLWASGWGIPEPRAFPQSAPYRLMNRPRRHLLDGGYDPGASRPNGYQHTRRGCIYTHEKGLHLFSTTTYPCGHAPLPKESGHITSLTSRLVSCPTPVDIEIKTRNWVRTDGSDIKD